MYQPNARIAKAWLWKASRLWRLTASLVLLAVLTPAAGLRTDAGDGSWTPLQISLWPPAQLASESTAVTGLRLCLPYGNNGDVYGVDVGLANGSTGNTGALQVGLVNFCRGTDGGTDGQKPAADGNGELTCGGAQFGGIANWNRLNTVWGVQIAGGVNRNAGLTQFTGLQIAGVGSWNDDADFAGVQISGIGGGGGARLMVPGVGGKHAQDRYGDVLGIQITGGGLLVILPIPNAVVGYLTANAAKHLAGVQIIGVGLNIADEDSAGLQVAGLANGVSMAMCGLQVVGFMNCAGAGSTCVQIGAINFTAGDSALGMTTSYDPNARESAAGMQIGVGNECHGHFTGVQIGVINNTQELSGVQIGVLNFIRANRVSFLPLVNASF